MMDLYNNTNNNSMATNHASSLQEEDSTHSQGGAYFGQTILAVHSKDVKFPQHVASDNEAVMSDSSGWHTDVSASEATSCLDSSEMESDYFAESATESLEASLLQTTTATVKKKKVKKSKSTDQKTTSTTINNKKKKTKKRVLPPKRASKTETVKTEVTETTATTFTSADSLMAVVVPVASQNILANNSETTKTTTTKKIKTPRSSPTSSSTKSKSSSATTLDKKKARRRKIAQQKQAEATMADDSLFSHDLQQNDTQIPSQTKKKALPTGKDDSQQQQEQQQHDNHHFNPSRLRRGWSMEDFSASSSNLDTDYDYDTNVDMDTSQQDDNARRRRKRRGKTKTVIGKPFATDNSAATTTTTTKKKVVKKKKPVAPTKTSNATSTKVLSTPKSPSLTGAASILRELIDAEVHKESPTANSHGKDDEEESLMLLPSFHESLAPSAHNPSSFLPTTTTSLAALVKDPYHLPSSSSNTPDDDTIRQLSLEHSLTSMEKEASLDVAKHGVRNYHSDSNTAAVMQNRRPISVADDKLLLLHPPAKTKRRSTLQHTNSTATRRTSDSKGHGPNVKRRQSHDGVVMTDASAASQRSKRGVRRTKSHDSTGVVRRNRSRSRSQRNDRSNGNGADTAKIMPRDRSRSRSQRKGRSNGNGTDGTEPLPRNRSRSRSQRMSGSTANATSRPNTLNNNRPRRSQSINLAVASQPMVKNAKRRRRPLPTESPGGTSRVSLATRTSINTMEQSVQSMPLNVPRGGGSDNGILSSTRRTPIDKEVTPSATIINQQADTTKSITNTKAKVKRTSSSSKSATGNTTKKKKRASGSNKPKQTSKVSSKDKKSLASLGAMPVSAGTSVATGHIASDSTGRNNVPSIQSATAANPKQKRENLISPFSVRSSDTKSFEDVSSNQSEASTIISGGTLATDAKALDLSLSSKSTVSKGIAQALASKPTNTNTNTQPKKQQQPASTTAIGSYFERESNSSHDVFAQGPKSRNAHDSISNSLEGSLLSDFSKSSGGNRKSKKSATNSSIASSSTASMRKKTISPFSSHAGFASSHTQATSLLATEHSNATSTPLIPDSDEENSDDDNHKSFSGSIPGPMSSAVDSPPATPKEEKKQGVAMKEALKAKKASVRKVVPKKETSAKAIAGEKSAATRVAPRKAAEGNVLKESTPKPVAQKAEAKETSIKTTPVFSATSKDATAKASTTKTPLAKKHSVKITPPITNGVPPAGKKSLSNKNVDGKTPQKPIVEDFVDPVLKKAPNPKPKTSVWDSLCCRSAHAVAS